MTDSRSDCVSRFFLKSLKKSYYMIQLCGKVFIFASFKITSGHDKSPHQGDIFYAIDLVEKAKQHRVA